MQIYRSLLTFFSSLSSSRYFKFPNSTQQQKKTYHKAIKQSQTVYEQSPNHLIRHHVPTATDQGIRTLVTQGHSFFRCLLIAGEGRGKRSEKTDHWSLIPCRISFVTRAFGLWCVGAHLSRFKYMKKYRDFTS